MVTAVNLPSQSDMAVPSLWIQSHKSRGCWPIKLVDHHGVQVHVRIVSREQLRTAVSATDVCVVVISCDGDLDVIAADALRVITPALCSNFR